MKKLYIYLLVSFSSLSLFSQVGVNTTNPNTSLDVQASRNSNGVIDNTQFFGIQAPRITRAELTNYTGSYGPDQNGALIYISDISAGNALASSPREFVTSVGYYYFESSSDKWRRLTDNTNSVATSAIKAENGLTATADNIVKLGGALKETTKITQGTNNFVFQGINAADNAAFNTYTNININTDPNNITNPALRVAHPVNTLNPALLLSGVNNGPNLAIGQASIIGFNPNSKSGYWPIGIGAEYINTATDQGSADFFIATSAGGTAAKKFVVTNAGNVGIGTVKPLKTLHVNGGLQLTNELNVGGTGTTVGNSGANGQLLVSKGAGNAPEWTTFDGLVPTKNGSVIALNGKLIVAQEIIVLMTADFTASGTPKAIGNLNNVILDNENKYKGTSTGNNFKVVDNGIYSLTMNIQFTAVTASDVERPVFGIWNDTKNAWVARINDTYAGSNKVQTATLITSIKLNNQDTYSFRTVASSSTDLTRTVTIFAYSAGDTGSGPVTQVSLKRTL